MVCASSKIARSRMARPHADGTRERGETSQHSAFIPRKIWVRSVTAGPSSRITRALLRRCGCSASTGWKDRYVSALPGINTRLDELQAAMLRVLLKHLREENARRREIAQLYEQLLGDTGLFLPKTVTDAVHVFHQYVIKTPRRDALQKFLAGCGIETQVHYPVPVHRQPAYLRRLFISGAGLRNTESVARQILSLPMSPHLRRKDVTMICSAVREAFANGFEQS